MLNRAAQFCLLVAAGFALFGQSVGVRAAATSAVYVDIRESEAQDAQVVERWKLYGASHALVIGIDNYAKGWPRLANAIKDARLVAAELERHGFDVTLVTNTSYEELRRALRRFFAIKGADPEARLFVWFAGHGHTEYGEGYIVPADAPKAGSPDFLLTTLHMGDISTMVRLARSKHVFAVFDSCFAGTIFASQRARPPVAVTRATVKSVRQFLTSGDSDQTVSDDGTFRSLFIQALSGDQAADMNRDGYLTGTELSLYLEDRMINLTQARQTPRSGKLRDPRFDQGDFIFVLPRQQPVETTQKAAAPHAPARDRPDLTKEEAFDLAFWEAIKDSESPANYRAYLDTYPKGLFAALAHLRTGPEPAPPAEAQPPAVEPKQEAALGTLPEAEPEAVGDPALEKFIEVNRRKIERAFKEFAKQDGLIEYYDKFLNVVSFDILSSNGPNHKISVFYFYCERDYGCSRLSARVTVLAQLADGKLTFLRRAKVRQQHTSEEPEHSVPENSGGF